MLFNSLDFLIFFITVFVVQLVLPHRSRNVFILAASYFFYACWDWRFLGLMLLSTLIDFYCSHGIAESDRPEVRKCLLVCSVVANLTILGFFKYFGFFMESMDALCRQIGLSTASPHLDIVLPVGISFYTFQTMSYTIDVYRRDLKRLSGFIDFALYVSFFPQLVAGPIERGARLAPQIEEGRFTSWAGIQDGTWLILKGLFKKAVIADNLAVMVQHTFAPESASSGPQLLLGTYAFAFQIYGDFSGYTDIARGVARILGYDLMLNFVRPYLATSPNDFWKRWHISLSGWLRDYLYIPLGGSRCSRWLTTRNLFITMLLGGLWHGPAWHFVAWGAYHGALLALWHRKGKTVAPSFGTLRWLFHVIVMFHLTCVGWMIFRVDSLGQLLNLFEKFWTGWSWSTGVAESVWVLAILVIPLMLVHVMQEAYGDSDVLRKLSVVPRTLTYAGTVFGILALGSFGGREFIYFQF